MAKTVNDTIFKDWLKLAEDFKGMVNKAVTEIHVAKQEVEDIKTSFLDEIHKGQYIWDPQCITISAPRIVIGNVDKNGELKSGNGTVIIKGSAVDLNGVGTGGNINLSAPTIRQRAVDPGIDGQEAVVYPASSIISQARSIVLDSKAPVDDPDQKGAFLPAPAAAGIHISSEQGIKVSATLSKEGKAEAIGQMLTQLNDESTALTQRIATLKQGIDEIVDKMNETLGKEKDLNTGDRDLTRSNVIAIDELNKRLKEEVPVFYKAMNEYVEAISRMLEVNRQKKCMDKEKDAEPQKDSADDFQKKSTGTSLTLESESILMHAVDGDGNYRTNPEAGIDVRGNDIKVRSMAAGTDENMSAVLTPKEAKGRVTIQSRNVTISTANVTDHQYDNDGKLKAAKFPLEGDVTILSKTINMTSVDMEQTEPKKMKETGLTTGGEINLRAQKVKVKTHNEKGESVGKFSVNSQQISLKATNIDGYKGQAPLDDQGNLTHEKMKSKSVAANSALLLLAEKVNVGYKSNELASQKLILGTEKKLQLHGNDQVIVTQGEKFKPKKGMKMYDDRVLIASSGEAVISGKSGVKLKGEVTLNSKFTGTDIEAKNIKASGSLTAPNIGDGMAIAGPAGSTDAIKEEDMDKSEI